MTQQEICQNIDFDRYEKMYNLMQEDFKNLSVPDQAMNHAAFSAVNNTYGKGINPEAVEYMKQAIEAIQTLCSCANLSSHFQMREAIEGAIEFSEKALNAAKLG